MIVSRRKVVRFKPVQGRKTGLQHRGTFKYHEMEIQIQYHFDSYQNRCFRFCIVHFSRQHCNLFVNFNLLQIVFFYLGVDQGNLITPKIFTFKSKYIVLLNYGGKFQCVFVLWSVHIVLRIFVTDSFARQGVMLCSFIITTR